MIKYRVNIKKSYIDLNLMGRVKTFKKDEEVHEDAYTKAYPKYFVRIGEVKGLNSFLANHVFIKDPITEFVEKEDVRKKHEKNETSSVKVSNIIKEDNEIIEEIEDVLEDINEDIKEDNEKIKKLIKEDKEIIEKIEDVLEDINEDYKKLETDVRIETEE